MATAFNVSSCCEEAAKANYVLSICDDNGYIKIIIASITGKSALLIITYACDFKMTTLTSKCSITDRKSKKTALFKILSFVKKK